MSQQTNQPRSRYNVSGNVEAEYVDSANTVLCNKLGIANLYELQTTEEKSLAHAYQDLLREVRTDTPLTCELLRHIHSRIFGELYEWAGKWRTVWISKPGLTWPAPGFSGSEHAGIRAKCASKIPCCRS
jgi:cell filamentation protein